MKLFQVTVFLCLVALCATTAEAQFGLYGSPELLDLSQQGPAASSYGQATRTPYWVRPAAPAARAVPMAAVPPPPLGYYPARPVQRAVADRYADLPAEPAPPESPYPPPATIPAEDPNGVDQMLSDSGGYGAPGYREQAGREGCPDCDPPCDERDSFGRAMYHLEQAVWGFYGGGPAEGWGPWYASASALVMGRNLPNRLWTTYETGNDPHQLDGLPFEWRWGGEIRFGRRFCCGSTWSLEATYWTLDPLSSFSSITHPNGVSTTLTVGNVFFGGYPATEWFDAALEHRLRRTNEVHNVELNVLRYRIFSTAQLPWDVDCLVGVRFFRFDENLVFSSVADPANMSDTTMDHEAFLDDRITNNLVGFQFGFDADYYIAPTWRVSLAPKFGIYNNHIEHRFGAYLGDGTVAQQYEYPGLTYPVNSTEDVVSFLTQVDLALEWQFARNWSAHIGYRVVAVTDVGLADHQIPHFIVDIPAIADIDHNANLILHGAVVGLSYNF